MAQKESFSKTSDLVVYGVDWGRPHGYGATLGNHFSRLRANVRFLSPYLIPSLQFLFLKSCYCQERTDSHSSWRSAIGGYSRCGDYSIRSHYSACLVAFFFFAKQAQADRRSTAFQLRLYCAEARIRPLLQRNQPSTCLWC